MQKFKHEAWILAYKEVEIEVSGAALSQTHPFCCPSPSKLWFHSPFPTDVYLLVYFLKKYIYVCLYVFQKFPGKYCITACRTASKDLNCRLKLSY